MNELYVSLFLKVLYLANFQLDFKLDQPLPKLLKEIDKYLFKKYGLNFENPTLTFTTAMNVFSGILFGHIEISSAHKVGDVSFEGSGEELMDFQAITSVINGFLQNF